MRNLFIFIGCLWAVVGSAVAIGATQSDYAYQLRGYVDATRDYPLPYRVPRLGVNTELMQYDVDELVQHFEWMEEANVRWVRQWVRWDEIEPTQGDFNWEAWDTIIEVISDYDLELVVVLMNSPEWARPEGRTASSTPRDLENFRVFARAFAGRYGDVVHHYQIWDEPNLKDAWGGVPPSPTGYMALLQTAHNTIKGVDESATILMGGLAPTTELRGDNISDIGYLRDLYALGANRYWDIVASKPYGFYDSPLMRDVDVNLLNFSRVVALREIMVEYGEAHKPLWASNWGWNALPEDWTGEASIWGQVGLDEQLFYTLDGLTRAREEWAWMGAMILEHWQPDAIHESARWGFALIDQNNQPTALWDALTSYDFDAVASNGLYHPLNDFTRYSGIWTLGELGADIGWLESSDSQFTFDFTGTDVSLLLREGDYFAFLYPQIDGESANATPRDNQGNSYIFLRSASDTPETNLVAVGQGLVDGEHVLAVTADKGWDQWALAGMAVSDGNQRDIYESQMVLSFVALALSVVASIVTGLRVDWGKTGFSRVRSLGVIWQHSISIITSIALLVSLFLTFNEGMAHFFRREASQYGLAILLSGGLIALTLPTLLVMMTSLVLFILIYNHIRIGIHLVLVYAPFILFPLELYQFAFPMAEYLLLITIMAGILHLLADWGKMHQAMPQGLQVTIRQMMLRWVFFDWAMLVWIGLGVMAFSWSTYRGVAITELRTLFIEPVLFYGLVRLFVHDVKGFQGVIWFFLVGVCLATAISLVQGVMGQSIITAEEGAMRLGGIYGSPNNLALYISRGLAFAFALMLIGDVKYQRWLGGGLVIILGATIFFTQSVGAILLGMPLSVVLIVCLVYGRRAIGIVAGLLGAGLVGVTLLAQVSARFANLFDMDNGTTFLRLRVWESAGAILRDYPLTGLGLDQFLYFYRAHYIRPDAIWDADLAHPHNILLDHWIRLGLAGVIFFMVLQWQLWHTLVFLWRKVIVSRWIVLGMMGYFGGILGHGLVDNAFFYPDLMLLVALLLGIIANWQRILASDV